MASARRSSITTCDTTSFMLNWLPTTGEFGFYGTFGDFDYHEKVATRLAATTRKAREDRQNQPGTNSIENSQIRLTDGSIIFTPDLFGPGITVENVTTTWRALTRGVKYQGLALEAEHYWRKLSDFSGHERRRDCRHRRPRVSGSSSRRWRSENAPAVRQRRGDPGPLWQRFRSARRRELVFREGTGTPGQCGVASFE